MSFMRIFAPRISGTFQMKVFLILLSPGGYVEIGQADSLLEGGNPQYQGLE